MVPPDSPLKSIKDLKGSNPPATIGIVTGSSAEFYFQMAMQVNGIEVGKDVILKNTPPGEQMALPKGIAGVVPWDPTPTMMVEERKNGRIIDSIFPYNMYEGQFYVRSEIAENAPDVVQAFSDAFAEATLWIRLNPEKAADLMAEDPSLKNFSKAILLQQIRAYNNLYKPTHIYPHAAFWGERSTRPSSSGCTGRTASRGRWRQRTSPTRWTRATWTAPSPSSAGRCRSSRPSSRPGGKATRASRRSRSTCMRSIRKRRRRFPRRATW